MNHRRGKRQHRYLIRFLGIRVRWMPHFAQSLQGYRIMAGVRAATARRA